MTAELHRIPKKQLDSELLAAGDNLSRVDGLDHTTAEVKAAVDAVETLTTPADINAAVEFVDQLTSTPAEIDAAVADRASVVEWQTISTSSYTATPASTSRITMSSTAGLKAGLALRYSYNGGTYYGIITALSANSYIDLAGAPLDTGQNLTALAFGSTAKVIQVDFFVADTYADGADDTLLASDMNTAFSWMGPKAYLVAFKVKHKTDDSGTQPKVNVMVNGQAVGTEDSGNGPTVSTSWVYGSAVALDATKYDINKDEAVEVACKAAGGTGDAADLTVECLFVLE
ncbi:MAG: hypothetical protein ABFE07_29580 [Armatimonadia bacterium]